MPFAKVSITKTLSLEEKDYLYDEINKQIKLIPGKEDWDSIIIIEDGCYIRMGEPDRSPKLYMEIRMMGQCPISHKAAFVASATSMLEEKFGLNKKAIDMKIINETSWAGGGQYREIPPGVAAEVYIKDKSYFLDTSAQ